MMFDNEPKALRESEYDRMIIPVWLFLTIFFAPAIVVVVYLYNTSGLDNTAIAIIGLAIMNGSINSVIAWLTIRLDGHSNDALEHLDTIMGAMEDFDDTISDGMENVSSFTNDLNEAKGIFSKVGVDLSGLDLEPVAEVVEKLKDNKTDLNYILDSLKEADFTTYIRQVKEINWTALLASIEEVMTFIEGQNTKPSFGVAPKVPDLSLEKEYSYEDEEEIDFFAPTPRKSLSLSPPKKNLDLRPKR